jgi:hypothetical protein
MPAPTGIDAELLAITADIRWTRAERSKDSHSTTTTITLERGVVALGRTGTGRARGRVDKHLSYQLTNAQLERVREHITANLTSSTEIDALMGRAHSTMNARVTTTVGDSTVTVVLNATRGEGDPSIHDNPAYKGASRLKAMLEGFAPPQPD